MQLPFKFLQIVTWVFLVSSSSCSGTTNDSQTQLMCGSPRNTLNSTVPMSFFPNYVNAMETLQGQVFSRKSGQASVSVPPPEVFGLAQCQSGLSNFDCNLCFSQGRVKLPRCIPNPGARIYLEGCFLRYDTYNFFHESTNPKYDFINCTTQTNASIEKPLQVEFKNKVAQLITNVSELALKNRSFATVEAESEPVPAYALAQCWDSLKIEECRECLVAAGRELGNCAPGAGGQAMFTGCYMRYSTTKFFNSSSAVAPEEGGPDAYFVTAIAIASLGFLILACFGAYIGYEKLSKNRKEEQERTMRLLSINSNLNFQYEVLEEATNYFSDEMKLGQGGAGTVFKGTLQDGSEVAVKRLEYTTRQWVDQFFNEVNLINGIQHNNLVRLLGCSIEGPESLLVYEYVLNKSLDQIIFVKKTEQVLSWEQRYKIIAGTAEGLAHLHGGCGVKIIHRDIKASNILIAEDLTPKISDFGLARFANDECGNSSIAGTLGYMAPEYLIRGQLTEKADVYGYGVLILEIACGKKNSVYTQGSSSILHTVWKHYKANTLVKSIDPRLEDVYSRKEAENVLQIGLVCTQTSSSLRPSMPEVVPMLRFKDTPIPSPKQPPFLNASVLCAGGLTESSITKVSLSTHVLESAVLDFPISH
ncbi:cysteine-rich receptor-like protein kinase 1 [Euphorbia lathyris]|uniref:cysteine-rich receptor-like protein kinase 1 n=1 Tax=Euphorbia lathyris TaxID=212925 RepID=UPI003313D596